MKRSEFIKTLVVTPFLSWFGVKAVKEEIKNPGLDDNIGPINSIEVRGYSLKMVHAYSLKYR